MKKIAKTLLPNGLKPFFSLTKPGIIFGNGLTALGGFALASRGTFPPSLFFPFFQGLIFIIASACIYNNLIDCELDQKMVRTQNRPLPRGMIAPQTAFFLATFFLVVGALLLAFYTNFLTLALTLAGGILYVCVYTFSKYKTRYGTWIGSLSGAIPPVVGYTAVSQRIDLAACLLFFMITFWQMPHFYAIAIFRIEDYARGSLPIMPIEGGFFRTKIEMILCCFAFIVTLMLFFFFYVSNLFYFSILIFLATFWWIFSIQGLVCSSDKKWARAMFFSSLIIVTFFSILIPLSSI